MDLHTQKDQGLVYNNSQYPVSKIDQRWATSVLEGHCPTKFSFNPNQTHLNKLIKVFRIRWFFRVGAKLCRTGSGPPGPKLPIPAIHEYQMMSPSPHWRFWPSIFVPVGYMVLGKAARLWGHQHICIW